MQCAAQTLARLDETVRLVGLYRLTLAKLQMGEVDTRGQQASRESPCQYLSSAVVWATAADFQRGMSYSSTPAASVPAARAPLESSKVTYWSLAHAVRRFRHSWPGRQES